MAAISSFLDERSCYIKEFAQFEDDFTGRLFARTVFHGESEGALPLARLRHEFAAIAARFDMVGEMRDATVFPRVFIMVSKFDHCLQDLLYRHRTGELRMGITTVISNHPDLEPLAQGY